MYKGMEGGGQMPGSEVSRTLKQLARKYGITVDSRLTTGLGLGDNVDSHEEISFKRNGAKGTIVVDRNKEYSTISDLVPTGNGDSSHFQDLRGNLQRIDMDRLSNGRYTKEEPNVKGVSNHVEPKKNRGYFAPSVQAPQYTGEEVIRNIKSYASEQGLDVDIRREHAGTPKDNNMYAEIRLLDPDNKKFGMRQMVGSAVIWPSETYGNLSGNVTPSKNNPKYTQFETQLKHLDQDRKSSAQTSYMNEKRVANALDNRASDKTIDVKLYN